MFRVVRRIQDKKIAWKSRKVPELKLYRSVNHCSNNNAKKSILLPPVRFYSSHHSKSTGGEGIIIALGAITIAGGAATLGYAKYDDDFRRMLAEYAPFTDDAVKLIFLEEGSGKLLSDYYSSVKAFLFGLMSGGKKDRTITLPPEPSEYKAPPAIVPALEKEAQKPEKNYREIRLEQKEDGEEELKIEIAGDMKQTSTEGKSMDLSNVSELESKIRKSAEEAVNAYNKAIYILKTYNQDIEYIIDEAVNEIKPDTWEKVKTKTKAKVECIKKAQDMAECATEDINKLKEMVSSPNFDAPRNTKELIKFNITKVEDDISKAKKELDLELRQGNVTEKYWDKVEKARQHFSEELESLFPLVDLSKKKLSVSEEDLDLFVLHTYATILFYQKELAKMQTILSEKMQQAVEAARKGGGEPLTNAQVCEAVDQEKRRLTLCFQQQVLKLKKEFELELREQLKRQSQVFSDHLKEALKCREDEVRLELGRKYDEILESERCQFKAQLAAIVGRLRGLDQAIRDKKQADEAAKSAQILWSACQALLRAIKVGCPGLAWKDQIRPLEPEITAVQKAASQNDELVLVVINGIPKEARERGVYPEDALRERFLKVEQVARTVALVPEEGAALPVHILSYLQSILLIKAASNIPQCELNDEKVDFSKLNTNDILQRARYWLDRGDFAQTLKYMNLLKGAPRCVAKQWMFETRILLETQQAANTLMAHAASSGLMYL